MHRSYPEVQRFWVLCAAGPLRCPLWEIRKLSTSHLLRLSLDYRASGQDQPVAKFLHAVLLVLPPGPKIMEKRKKGDSGKCPLGTVPNGQASRKQGLLGHTRRPLASFPRAAESSIG